MRERAEIVKADEVVERARKVAGRLVEERLGQRGMEDVRIGWHPGHGTVGLIMRREMVKDLSHDQTFDMAVEIANGIGDFGLPNSTSVLILDDHLIVGLIPAPLLELGRIR